jgi:hypothetical protein
MYDISDSITKGLTDYVRSKITKLDYLSPLKVLPGAAHAPSRERQIPHGEIGKMGPGLSYGYGARIIVIISGMGFLCGTGRTSTALWFSTKGERSGSPK